MNKKSTSTIITPSPSDKELSRKRVSRASRFASMFSNRTSQLPSESATQLTLSSLSPSRSDSSTGYVGWPGTQNKQGTTVVEESSYEESEASVDTGIMKGYQQQVQKNAETEISNWMGNYINEDVDVDVVSEDICTYNSNSDSYQSENSNSPIKYSRFDREKIHRLEDLKSPERQTNFGAKTNGYENYGGYGLKHTKNAYFDAESNMIRNTTSAKLAEEQWDDGVSDISTSYSKTSSAYFNVKDIQAMEKCRTKKKIGINRNRLAAAAVMRRCLSSSGKINQTQFQQIKRPLESLTEEALAMKDHFSPPVRNFNNAATVGYPGLLDRTQDVPNLMDETQSDSTSAISESNSRRSSTIVQDTDRLHDFCSNTDENSKVDKYSSSSSSCSPCPPLTCNGIQEQRRKRQQHATIIEEKCEAFDRTDQIDVESDVFDGISYRSCRHEGNPGTLGATCRASMDKINVALLGGGLTAIQTTNGDFTNRKTASDFDETLTNSDYDQNGFVMIPAFHDMVTAGMRHNDRSFSSQSLLFSRVPPPNFFSERQNQNNYFTEEYSGDYEFSDRRHVNEIIRDFSEYYIPSEKIQVLVKKYRKISLDRYPRLNDEDLEREEDATKAFALSEMRSRIMETDIERGLERRGGTIVVDDIVMTSYNKAALRVRDAVIVAKAWRDGATPQDVINTANLTRRPERCYSIPRLEITERGAPKYSWEEVNWVDDNELSRYRCHSIGPRHLKGVEIFTIGDCQSILLKLCNDRSLELRHELNRATADQIEAERLMKEEGEIDAFDGMMTEAEMIYLTSMEAVKSISQKLVLVEKAFNLVKNRIEKLVAKYEALLIRFENETDSVAPSSVFSYESSTYAEDFIANTAKEKEEKALARRAERAELHAEVVARESMLNQELNVNRKEERETELNNLKDRLADLQSESSAAITERDHSVVLARAITRTNHTKRYNSDTVDRNRVGEQTNDRLKIDNIKQRFRDKSAAKFQFDSCKMSDETQQHIALSNNEKGNSFHRTVGEEMFQHLDFYERSLRAVAH